MDKTSMTSSKAWARAGKIPKRAVALPGPQHSLGRITAYTSNGTEATNRGEKEVQQGENSWQEDPFASWSPGFVSGGGGAAERSAVPLRPQRTWRIQQQVGVHDLGENSDDDDVKKAKNPTTHDHRRRSNPPRRTSLPLMNVPLSPPENALLPPPASAKGKHAANANRFVGNSNRSNITKDPGNFRGEDSHHRGNSGATERPAPPIPDSRLLTATNMPQRTTTAMTTTDGSDVRSNIPHVPPPPRSSRTATSLSSSSTKPSAILHTLLISALEVYLSTLNAWHEHAWKFNSFEQYIYLASSAMEILALAYMVLAFTFNKDRRVLGEPLVVLSTGVLDNDLDIRIEGFNRTILQALANLAMFGAFTYARGEHAYWTIGAIGLIIAVVGIALGTIMRRHRRTSTGATAAEQTEGRREVPRWIFILTLPFSPVVVDVLESIFLLRGELTQDSLLLVAVDLIAVVPAIYWVALQGYYSILKKG